MRGLKHPTTPPVVIDPDQDFECELASECDAFLGGSYLEDCHRRGVRPPVWAWVNEAAHAHIDRLRATAGTVLADDPDIERRTRGTIARAALCSLRDRDLDELQRDVLVPLELRLAGTELTPRRLIELVGRALYL